MCALLAVTFAASGCGGDDDEQEASAGGEAREFVGTVEGVDASAAPGRGQDFVAVTFDGDKVVAYVCDGTGSGAQLFEGEASGDEFDLTSTGDARLTGTVADGAVEGEVTVDGKTVAYTTKRAEGIGGLYTVERQEGGETAGRSVRGNALGVKGGAPDGRLTVTTTDGEQTAVKVSKRSPGGPPYSQVRVIMLDSGQRRGQKTIKARQTGAQTNFTCPSSHGDAASARRVTSLC